MKQLHGYKNTPFEITLSEKYFIGCDMITMGGEGSKASVFKVIDVPTKVYGKWYHKVLRFLSFGKLFEEKYTYTIERISI